MPKSKGRRKTPGQRYQLEPDRKKPAKTSPRWYGPLILGVMGVGVALIVLNYIGVMPGTNGTASNVWLWSGLGLIGLGFLGTMYWR